MASLQTARSVEMEQEARLLPWNKSSRREMHRWCRMHCNQRTSRACCKLNTVNNTKTKKCIKCTHRVYNIGGGPNWSSRKYHVIYIWKSNSYCSAYWYKWCTKYSGEFYTVLSCVVNMSRLLYTIQSNNCWIWIGAEKPQKGKSIVKWVHSLLFCLHFLNVHNSFPFMQFISYYW